MAVGLAAILVVGALGRSGLAHHSFAMYDTTTTKTLTGKLVRFIPGSNHAQLIFELLGADGKPVLDGAGNPVVWGVETGPAFSLARHGVTVKSFTPGTILTVTLNPLRDGRNFGALRGDGGLIGCGTTWPEGGCNETTGRVFIQPTGPGPEF
ncbi:MAG: hypothetical protein A3I61_18715 [Acidobacteria bacterium RIFCSPLOWO2_02_FULL_68_18]|nr:MAG: hypothetical protein A3I61_18715 [Acidobacteria bacterium RIFCSPLOWO2_02_FULL_68_18]OFW48077.1 MAG: hypothetical protein A3G77_11325 [Acidobacteria bacterium RIFCSPLOWO2_12_FULL_68_19]